MFLDTRESVWLYTCRRLSIDYGLGDVFKSLDIACDHAVGCDRSRGGTVPNLWLASALSDTTMPCLDVNGTNKEKSCCIYAKKR